MSKDQNISVIMRTNSPELEEELASLVLAEDGFRVAETKGSQRTDILIYELGANTDKEFDQIQSLLEAKTVGEVFVISAKKESDLILRAMRAGVKEFISLPIDEAELKNALLKSQKRIAQNPPVSDQKTTLAGRIIK